MKSHEPFSHQSVASLMRTDLFTLKQDMTVQTALDSIRINSTESQVLYFYITDYEGRLVGVVSTRALLISRLDVMLCDIMDTRIRSVPVRAEVMDILTDFMVHRFLAFPVVDEDRVMVGIIDVSVFTDNISDILERDKADEVFETIGFRLSTIQGASPFRAFKFRFPWLLATIASGVICALMVSRFEDVLAAAIVLSFYMTLVLGLGESVSMQSMTVAIQTLRVQPPTLRWFGREFFKELGTALLLGLGSGLLVGTSVLIWKKDLLTAAVVGGSLVVSMASACLIGLSIPTVLHALKLDPKISAGPLTLAISDLITIFIYFSLAALVL
ncbi:MAG: magnesium transporter [Candidatus Cloacimonadaceae bacterium]|nr:magnesium transporter [Candidatus Cloacimonadaceae bacterium]